MRGVFSFFEKKFKYRKKPYITYLLLSNKLPPNLAALNSVYLPSHVTSVGQKLKRGLAVWFWIRNFPELVVKLLARAAVI